MPGRRKATKGLDSLDVLMIPCVQRAKLSPPSATSFRNCESQKRVMTVPLVREKYSVSLQKSTESMKTASVASIVAWTRHEFSVRDEMCGNGVSA